MGSKCFRPVNENNQPVYVSSINKALQQAKRIYLQKKVQKVIIIDEIIKNQQRKGNVKKLFDHLHSHHKNILPAIKECNKITTYQKSFPAIVVSNMFCQQLVKMFLNKKLKLSTNTQQENGNSGIISKRNIMTDEFSFRNLIHQIQSHFFELVIKILVYTKQKQIQNNISQTLIKYSTTYQQKITAKKQLKSILDLYLTMVFQKNIQLIDKNSFLPFYAYSTLISKSKTQLFTGDFIQKHFNFILKLFFELEDTKISNKTLVQSQDFDMFEQSVQGIIKQFILFSSQNKKIKDHILYEIMFQQDAQKFDRVKTIKLQKIIKQNLNTYSRQHFMFDWLGYLVRYIGRKTENQNQNIRDIRDSLLIDSMLEMQFQNLSTNSLKNISSIQSKAGAIQTLRRWFIEQLLKTQKTLQYFSIRIFEALLLNLYSSQSNYEQVISKSKQLLNYILSKKPNKLTQILIILNKQLRKNKNQYFYTQHQHNNMIKNNNKTLKKRLQVIQEQAAQGLWENDIIFIIQGLKVQDSNIQLNNQEIQQLYAPIIKQNKPSINLLYLIQLAGIGLKYCNLQNQNTQIEVYNFLISLITSMKISDSDIQIQYLQKFIQKNNHLSYKLLQLNQPILYSFLKHSFKNLFKQQQTHQIWTQILVLIIVINIVIEQKKSKKSQRINKLQKFLNQVINIVKIQNFTSTQIYQLYQKNKNLFDFSQRFSAHLEKIKLKTLEQFQHTNEANLKSMSNIEQSVLSSRFDVSESNPDSDFKWIFKAVANK